MPKKTPTFKISSLIRVVLLLLLIIALTKVIFCISGMKKNGLLEQQQTLLDKKQLVRLHSIKRGRTTKKDVEIVISRYNENIAWSDMYTSIRTIYDKGENGTHLPINTPGKVIRLPNLGRESNTYLRHIVNNYHTLAKLTVFCQASAPYHGYNVRMGVCDFDCFSSMCLRE